MAEKSMKNGSKIRWMGATYISLYQKMGDAYIKPISAYITGWWDAYIKPISKNGGNLYQAYIG